MLARCPLPDSDSAPAGLLSPAEAEVLSGLRFPKRRRDWLAGRIAAKSAVGGWLRQRGVVLSPERIEVLPAESGAPALRLPAGCPVPSLSISHDRFGGAAAADAEGGLVGIDVESIEPRSPGFLETVAHESERPGLDDDAALTELWTAKEAVAKLLGTGLTVGFWDIRLVFEAAGRRLELHGAARARWESLGRPEIFLESRSEAGESWTIARAGKGGHGG